MEKNNPTLEKNSINTLELRFENLLLGINTKKDKYTSERQKEATINAIKSFVKERISEKKLDPNSEFWKIILEINCLDFESIEKISRIYSKLFNLSEKKSSNYYKQLGRE